MRVVLAAKESSEREKMVAVGGAAE
jgi:hypothetical protein